MRASAARALGALFLAGIGACVATACTHDFEAFDPGSASPLTEGDATADALPSRTDASSGDAGVYPGADARVDAGCAPAAACVTAADACEGTCDSDRTTCTKGCSGGSSGRSCRDRCDSDRDRCRDTCRSTCRQCATDLCSDACR